MRSLDYYSKTGKYLTTSIPIVAELDIKDGELIFYCSKLKERKK